jgi:hypothetical protein
MTSGWLIFLFLFVLGVTCQGFNQMGIWDIKEPNASFTMDTSTVTNTQTQMTGTPLDALTPFTMLITFLTIIGSGIIAVFSLSALFIGMGWPIGLVGAAVLQMIQLPANLIMFVWLFELWTGRNVG